MAANSPSVPSPHSFVRTKTKAIQAKADLFGIEFGSVSANNLAILQFSQPLKHSRWGKARPSRAISAFEIRPSC